MAVPGPITSDLSAGCHHIIREWQGTLVTSAAEVIECLSPVAAAPGQSQLAPRRAASAVLNRDELDPEAAAVLDALPSRGGMGPSRIGHRAGLDPATVVRCLGALAAGGFAERCEQGWRLRRA
jgi:DNA processing protein